jgi:glycosyltransferase involved in cell wall biosynthesis
MRKLNQLHPGYDALIHEFQKADPLAESRRRLDSARWETFRTGADSVLLVTHGRGGGVKRHVVERAAVLRAEGLRPIMLWPAPSRTGEGHDCILGNGSENRTPNLRFSIPSELDLMAKLLRADSPVRAEVHHMIGHDHELMGLFGRLNIPYEMFIHDYSSFCPRINMVAGGRYCGEPDLAGCEACIADFGFLNEEATPPGILHHRSAIAMYGASAVIVPSTDVAIRMKRHFQSVEPKIVNWEDDDLLPAADPVPFPADGIRRVCVIGRIGVEKGYDILLACARDIAARKLPLKIHLVGYSCDDDRLTATGSVHITGQYEEQDAVRLIRQQEAQLAWLPAIWPETWSYTLTQAWRAGLKVFAFDIGAPAERIKRNERGWVCPVGMSPQALNDRVLGLQPMKTERSSIKNGRLRANAVSLVG